MRFIRKRKSKTKNNFMYVAKNTQSTLYLTTVAV